MSSPSPPFLVRRHDDCIPCRLVSGFGVIGMGVYLYSQAKHRPAGIGRNSIFVVSAGNIHSKSLAQYIYILFLIWITLSSCRTSWC